MRSREIRVNLQPLFGKSPPHAPEAEMAVLGSILLDHKHAWPLAARHLLPADFYTEAHGIIYRELLEHCDKCDELDMVLIYQRLKDRGVLEVVGGLDRLIEIAESVPSSASVEYYAKIVQGKSVLRKLIEKAGLILHDCYHSSDHADEVLTRAMDALLTMDNDATGSEIIDQATLVQDVYAEIESRAEMETPSSLGVPTGIPDLDYKLVGLEDGTMTVLAGRTSDGKTALALQWAESFSRNGKRPLVFNLEMNKTQLGYRRIAGDSGVSGHALRMADLRGDDWSRVQETVGRLSNEAIDFAITPGLDAARLRTIATQRVKSGRCGAIFIDHLGLMRAPRAENRNLALGDITRDVKHLALELKVPIVLLVQLNREAGKEDKAPMLEHLRESGHIEEDCDNAVLIHRPEKELRTRPGYTALPGQEMEPVNLYVRKNRQGPLGVVEMWFDAGAMRFKAKSHDQFVGRVA